MIERIFPKAKMILEIGIENALFLGVMIHVLIAKEQSEELSLEQVNQRFRDGVYTGEELAWKEGLDQWVPLSTIPGLTRNPMAPPMASSNPAPTAVSAANSQPASFNDLPQKKVGIVGGYKRILAVLMLGGGLWILGTDYWFIWTAVQTTGFLTSSPRSHTVGSKNRHTEYYVDYTYDVEGRSYTGHDSIRHLPDSTKVTVFYTNGNPVHSKAELPDTGLGWVFTLLGGGLLLYYFQPWNWARKGF